jgi:uncharacterized protein (TIGR02266 family)
MRISLMHPAIGRIAVDVSEGGLVLGRAGSGAELELNWDTRVSRRHARVWAIGRELWIEDLGSKNGCWFGKERLQVPVRLEPGMSVLVGETILSIAEGDSPVSPDTQPSLEALPLRLRQPATEDLPKEPPPAPAKPAEKTRAHPRLVTHDRVEVKVADRAGLRELWVKDISHGGLFVATETPPSIGQRVEVRIQTPAGEILMRAQVVHAVDARKARLAGIAAGVGLQFVDVTQDQRRAIQAYVDGLAERLFGVQAQPEVTPDVIESAIERAKKIIERVEHNDLYAAIEVEPGSTDSGIKSAIRELREQLSSALASAGPTQRARIERALSVLDRVAPLLCDPHRRLEYDFRYGHVRADDRIAEARAKTGPSIPELRKAWLSAAPERVVRAAALTRKAFAAREMGNFEEAIAAANEALENNPFFDELRSTLHVWEDLAMKDQRRR